MIFSKQTESRTLVVNKRDAPYDVYIGRGSKWGNPFPMNNESERDAVIDKYKNKLLSDSRLLAQVWELRGKTLGCYCKPKKCHGDVLATLADSCVMEFKKNYRFLSNFTYSFIEYDGITYPTVEHYFQAMKTKSRRARVRISKASTPSKAKYMGRSVDLRSDWEHIKDTVMWNGLIQKFYKGSGRTERLLATGDTPLVEGNTWGDSYWGVDLNKNTGKNMLGALLMEVRKLRRKGD